MRLLKCYLEEIKINLILKEYETPFKLYDDLKNKKIDAIIINEAYLDLLEEYIKIDIKVIKQIEIKEEIEQIKTDIELFNYDAKTLFLDQSILNAMKK